MSKKFRETVKSYLVSVGAKPEGSHYHFELDTEAGLLWVSIYDGEKNIFCRFKDVDRAKAAIENSSRRLNRFSGKWNFHFRASTSVEDCMQAFKYELEPLLKEEKVEKVEPVIRLYFCDICTVTVEQFEQLQQEVTADAIADPDRASTRILAQLILEHRGRYVECVRQIRKDFREKLDPA